MVRRAPPLAVAVLVAACGAPPPPPVHAPMSNREPAPAVVAAPAGAPSLATLVGAWHGLDKDRWGYELRVGADGSFVQDVHQGGGETPGAASPVCRQRGTLTVSEIEIVRTFRTNDCNHSYDGKAVHDKLITLEPDHLALRMEGDYEIDYTRAAR